MAVLYAREGADVAIVYLDEHLDAEETKRMVEKEGRRCITIAGDVADFRFCEAAVEQTIAEFGRLDILVNNAAFQEHAARLEDLTEQHFDRTIKTNLYGYFHMAKAAVPHMQPGSAIVMTGSVSGIEGSKYLSYSMTKGGIHAFAARFRRTFSTGAFASTRSRPARFGRHSNQPTRRPGRSPSSSNPAVERAAQPEEIAPAFVFMAAPGCAG